MLAVARELSGTRCLCRQARRLLRDKQLGAPPTTPAAQPPPALPAALLCSRLTVGCRARTWAMGSPGAGERPADEGGDQVAGGCRDKGGDPSSPVTPRPSGDQ